jgi:hypothetical protein
MKFPINPDTEIIVKFQSRKQHEQFCHETGAGSRFIYRTTENDRVHVLCRLDRRILKYGEYVTNPLFLTGENKPLPSAKITNYEKALLENR